MKEYLRHKIFNVINIKGLVALEFLDLNGKYKNYTESHDFWEICYVKNGEITLIIDEKKYHLSKNQLMLVPPNHEHQYNSKEDSQNDIFVVCFESASRVLNSLAFVKFYLDEEQSYSLNRIIYEAENTFKMGDNELLETIQNPNFGGKQAILLQLEYLLICLTRKLSDGDKKELFFLSDKDFHSDLVDVIISFLNENIRTKLSLNDICERMNCSRSFLCKIFKEQMGETIFSYFNKLKVEEAKNMLCEKDLSISDISYSLGFNELKYFDFFFKKYVGMTPNNYRKKKLR